MESLLQKFKSFLQSLPTIPHYQRIGQSLDEVNKGFKFNRNTIEIEQLLKPIPQNSECIILIHGLARTSRCMKKAATILQNYGYQVFLIDYPSRKKPIEELVDQYLAPLINKYDASGYKKIHFLTHSMGGILLRYCLSSQKPNHLGKAVMLAPPNKGSEIVDKLSHLTLFSLLNGPAGKQIGTDKESMPIKLGRIDFDTGIIAGCRSLNPLLSLLIKGENDGKVSIERTKIKGMKDFLVMPYTHVFIMQKKQTIYQSLYFIQQGRFYKNS